MTHHLSIRELYLQLDSANLDDGPNLQMAGEFSIIISRYSFSLSLSVFAAHIQQIKNSFA